MLNKTRLRNMLVLKFGSLAVAAKKLGINVHTFRRYFHNDKKIEEHAIIGVIELLFEDDCIHEELAKFGILHPRFKFKMKDAPKSFCKIMNYMEKYGLVHTAKKLDSHE